MNIDVFRRISYGVYIVSAMDGDRPTGCVANSIMQITAVPATIAISMNRDNFTTSCIEKEEKFAIMILGETVDSSLIGTFGYQSGRDIHKFDNISYKMVDDLPVLEDTCGYLICKVVDKMEASTHTVYLAQVVDGDVCQIDENQMTYDYYHKVLRGSSPKNAPTYIAPSEDNEEQKDEEIHYVCQVCQYEYVGKEMPIDYKCPICGQGPDKFKRV